MSAIEAYERVISKRCAAARLQPSSPEELKTSEP